MAVNTDERVADRYRAFSRQQTRGKSPLYEELTARIAEDEELVGLISGLPAGNKQQPNLLLAAVRYLGGPYEDWAAFRSWVAAHWDSVREVILARFTQTNEAARCATLLPVLAGLPQPLALLEVGASAGLCLYPDRYRYAYDGGPDFGAEGSPAVFRCRTAGGVPVPRAVPEVVWRGGIDLNPLDVGDPGDVRWLESLIWPGQEHRVRQLRAAIEAVRGAPGAHIVQGDLVDRVAEVAARAAAEAPDATLVVFHTAVLTYLPLARRQRFAELVRALPGHWVSNEHHSVLPWLGGPRPDDGHLLTLAVDGRPVALTDGHGQSVEWLE
ncbi:MAG: hypothetical protein QOF44_2864 [Streptomyces sp.]|nr:hypothetical protein [Streptomyces sp.]